MITRKLLIATSNLGKVLEIEESLAGLPLEIEHLGNHRSIQFVEESGTTYDENAILKAEFYARATGMMSLSDDSGLELEALNGRPGIHTARYGGADVSNEVRIDKLLNELRATSTPNRTARFICSLALCSVLDGEIHLLNVTHGECRGSIATEPRGDKGFGYDPIFIPNGFDATFAQVPDATKRKISHRAIALNKMRDFLNRHLVKLDPPNCAT